MAIRVRWAEKASRDVAGIFAYISQDSKAAANTILEKIARAADDAAEFPLAGRTVPEFGKPAIREVFVASYRIVYLIKRGCIFILRVSHSARVLKLKK